MIYYPSRNGSIIPYYKLWNHQQQALDLPKHPGPPTSLEILQQVLQKNKGSNVYKSDACFRADTKATLRLLQQVKRGDRRLGLPIINVGMPKAGSSTLYNFFRCAGLTATHDQSGFYMRSEVALGRPPVLRRNQADALLQLDANFVPCAFPQVDLLDELHAQYPQSTFVLNFRPIPDWIRSAQRWGQMTLRWANCSIPGLTCTAKTVNGTKACSGKDLARWWCGHVRHARTYVQTYASHALVELDLHGSETAGTMSRLFGTNASCWGHSNKYEDALQKQLLRNPKTVVKERASRTRAAKKPATRVSSTPPFAYVFMITGCNPYKPSYRFYIYNVLISVHILRELGSKADFCLILQITVDSDATEIRPEEIKWLNTLGVQIYYMEKQETESFYRMDVEKLKALSLTQYDKVLFLDSDLLPHANLDYVFELSLKGILMENVGIQGHSEPVNGGFWLAKTGGVEELQERVVFRESCCNVYPFFDTKKGWGHEIMANDYWEGARETGKQTAWTFLGAFAGQGVLYHQLKYERKSLSIFSLRGDVEHWGRNASGHVDLLRTEVNPCLKVSKPLLVGPPLRNGAVTTWPNGHGPRNPPVTDMTHFTGRGKPWISGPPEGWSPTGNRSLLSPLHFWFSTLDNLNRKLNLGIDFDHWKGEKPTLGFYPTYNQVLGADTNLLSPLIPANTTRISPEIVIDDTIHISTSAGTTIGGRMTRIPQSNIQWSSESALAPGVNSSFAYVFVIGGCDPMNPSYVYFVYNVLVAVQILREQGSMSDFVVIFQIKYDSLAHEIRIEEAKWLKAKGVHIYYMEKQDNESFYRINVEKLRALSLTRYEKIIYLDSDVMPCANLDYLFELSRSGVVMENVGLQGKREPINGGFWLAQTGSLDKLQQSVTYRETCCPTYPYFDVKRGWGHEIVPPDRWEAQKPNQSGTTWEWYGSDADQGLLYYHFKYLRKNLTIFRADGTVQHWGPSRTTKGQVDILATVRNPCLNVSWPLPLNVDFGRGRNPPMTDIKHFAGPDKPWVKGPPKDWEPSGNRSSRPPLRRYWFGVLADLNRELAMRIDFANWNENVQKNSKPDLGSFPRKDSAITARTNLLAPLKAASDAS